VGKLLHEAIHRWEYPHPEALQQFLERSALEIGIFDLDQRHRAIRQAQQYLLRLQKHPMYKEINQANKRFHEVPYELLDEPQSERGRLDILYQTEDGWKIVDFKTDHLAKLSDLEEERRCAYRAQLLRYQNSVNQQLKEIPLAQFCFLNCGNAIQIVSLEDF
jgi:ATP-dependent exoDNAse (exonuclease V) beta subunit